MPQHLPSLNALRAFEAAARHLSFSKAAEELHVTPAAISHQIKGLEDYLGVQLFHRLNKSLVLTDEAQAGLAKLQEGFNALAEGVSQILGHQSGNSLTVGVAPSLASKWLVPRLPRFAARHPDIELRITAAMSQVDTRLSGSSVLESFRDEGLDVSLRFGRGDYTGCRADKLFPASAVPLCSPRLLGGRHPLNSPEDLAHHTLLHDDTLYEGNPEWSDWLKAAGVTGVNAQRGLHFNHVALALEAAIEGQGVVLSIDALAAGDLAAGRLVMPFEVRLPLQNAYWLVSLEETADEPKIAAFRTWALEEARHRTVVAAAEPVA